MSTLLGLLQVWPLAILVDTLVTSGPRDDWTHRFVHSLLPADRGMQIILLAGATLLLRLLQELINMGRTLLSHHVGYNGLMRVRCELYKKLQELRLLFHKSQAQGDVIYRLSSDTSGCQAILNVVIGVAVAAVTLAVLVSIMLSRSLTLTLIVLSVAPLLFATNVWFGSHRLSTVMSCDQILVLHDGRLVEQGTHADLLARQGYYFQLAKHQLHIEEPRRMQAAVA